jgi:hypothetical protein
VPSNVLDYITVDELRHAIHSYNDYMAEIPTEFTVLEEHLNGLTSKEFCAAFAELRDVAIEIYRDLEKQPDLTEYRQH